LLPELPPDLEVIAATTCENGACPTLYRHRITGDVYVQGYLPDGSEGLVRIPPTDWATLIAQNPQ
jgi:hypothetical protein